MWPVPNRDEIALPTVYLAYQAVEDYIELLARSGIHPACPIRPIDALAFRLLVAMMPNRPVLVDLASDSSSGSSSVLCRCNTDVRNVLSIRSVATRQNRTWLPILADFIAGSQVMDVAPSLEFADVGELRREHLPVPGTIVLCPTEGYSAEEVKARAADLLEKGHQVVIVFMSLRETGACGHIRSILNFSGIPSVHRFALLREQSPFLHECQLGVVFHHSNPFMVDALSRIRQLFTGNFSFLGMTRKVCEAAIAAAQDTQFGSIRSVAEARRILAVKDQEMAEITNGLAFKIAHRVAKIREILVPKHTLRYRMLRRSIQFVRILKSSGVKGVLQKLLVRFGYAGRSQNPV